MNGRRRDAASGSERHEAPGPADAVRLNKYLADHGIASRRHSDQLIAEGKVMVDDRIVRELGTKIDPSRQRVEVDGVVLDPRTRRSRYYLLNKPAGVVCTNDEHEAKPRAIDLVTDRQKGRIYTVGRLDEDTVGLVVLTNDGDFAHRVMHPRYGVPKTYVAKLDGRIDDGSLARLREGVHLAEGRTGRARAVVLRRTPTASTVQVTLQEGRNREVRRIFAKLGWKVTSLRRTRIGRLTDRRLKVGRWRPLTREEVDDLLYLARAPEDEKWAACGARSPERMRRGGPRGAHRGRRAGGGDRPAGGGGGRERYARSQGSAARRRARAR